MTDITKSKKTKTTKTYYVKSVAWLLEATFRGYVGFMLLNHFRHNYVAVAASVYALVTAGLIVISHFVKAHKA